MMRIHARASRRETRYRDPPPPLPPLPDARRSLGIDFFFCGARRRRLRSVTGAERCAANYLLVARNRGRKFIYPVSLLARRPLAPEIHGFASDGARVRPFLLPRPAAFHAGFDAGESAGHPGTGSRRPGDFGGFCRFIRLVRRSASQCGDAVACRFRSAFGRAIAAILIPDGRSLRASKQRSAEARGSQETRKHCCRTRRSASWVASDRHVGRRRETRYLTDVPTDVIFEGNVKVWT